MRRLGFILLFLPAGACEPGGGLLIDEPEVAAPGEGWYDEPVEQPDEEEPESEDLSAFEGAVLRVLAPAAGELVPLGEPYTYEAELIGADGQALTPDRVQWLSDLDVDFHGDALAFDDDDLEAGTHELTVVADLPTGDRIAHTVGGVLVQHASSGTYSGLFSVDGTVNGITITCTGSALLVLGPVGHLLDGDGDCLVSLLGVDVPMTWVFDLENDPDGTLIGEAGVELLGWFSWDLPAEGTLDAAGAGIDLSFEGDIPFVGDLAGYLEAPRVSLDAD